jgi:hypothetical protein
MYKSPTARWRQIYSAPTREACDTLKLVHSFPPAKMILEIVKKYAPTVPTSCPVLRGWQRHNLSVSTSQIKEDEFFWGNFYPPSGLYKFMFYARTADDPEGITGEWVTEIKPKKGQMGTAEW